MGTLSWWWHPWWKKKENNYLPAKTFNFINISGEPSSFWAVVPPRWLKKLSRWVAFNPESFLPLASVCPSEGGQWSAICGYASHPLHRRPLASSCFIRKRFILVMISWLLFYEAIQLGGCPHRPTTLSFCCFFSSVWCILISPLGRIPKPPALLCGHVSPQFTVAFLLLGSVHPQDYGHPKKRPLIPKASWALQPYMSLQTLDGHCTTA